jgi:RNA polymerase sigma factor (sigma-70 family)
MQDLVLAELDAVGEDDLRQLDDEQLIDLTRGGSSTAYAVLFARHRYAAHRLARHLGQQEESDDVVSESFAQVFDLLQRGKGPDSSFRAYLFTTVRHESGRRAKARQRVMPTDDESQIDHAVPFGAGQLDGFEKSAVRGAYESLPERWRTVLWHLDVEGLKPRDIADRMELTPNSVSALVYRARSALREAYLQQHIGSETLPGDSLCRSVRDKLASVVRRTASMRDQEKVHGHLATCRACMEVYVDLREVDGSGRMAV